MSLRDRFVSYPEASPHVGQGSWWVQARFRRATPICLLVAIFSTSCICLPFRSHEPYRGKKTGFIQEGVTTKDEIIAELGSPRSELLLERGSLLVYDASGDTEWFCAAGAPGPGLAGGGGTFGVSYRYLLRVFLSDENTVAWTEVTRVKSKRFSISKDCPAAGLCYDRGGWMFLASRSSERGIKESTVPFDLCAIFIYSDAKSYVTIDDIPGSVLLNEESFVHRLVSPGVHRVSRHKTEFEFECEAGRPYFLRVESEDGMRLVDTDIGRDETRDRRLILNARDPWTEDRAIQQDTAF